MARRRLAFDLLLWMHLARKLRLLEVRILADHHAADKKLVFGARGGKREGVPRFILTVLLFRLPFVFIVSLMRMLMRMLHLCRWPGPPLLWLFGAAALPLYLAFFVACSSPLLLHRQR